MNLFLCYDEQMQEYITEALVLDKEEKGELDELVTLFTPHLGKVVAKIMSGKKITSKLSGHLEPGYHTHVRLIQKNAIHIGDALKRAMHTRDMSILRLVKAMTYEHHSDPDLWRALKEKSDGKKLLTIFGFDAESAMCYICNVREPAYFVFQDAMYCCNQCFPGTLSLNEYYKLPLSEKKENRYTK
ncbi:MAG: hypothetical protein COU08_00340 [Candidatus Harrisonbacteria bacterium CG10_big_fil_rev_8_21_14_0_10_42_17]|uniref:DNA replication/recombination mediator RecO N-terminal domain-containing protein n=1 Tax=Candidatus Harrisonbacteria bacterium CG10_big_fil_rev_8_21_14_0_10_42_17 TaxID=1974584 RepID=A0A2M6WJ35_9BACT|nr:MAG: hypothetical protein COU08_00340 [Candidatus Harrisonbacteria bacterium CG10_big_fil_rev_8_21_14_0_10_42_17]